MFSRITPLLFAASATTLTTLASAQNFTGDPFQKYHLSAKGINASFIPYGARLTNLYVADRNGTLQDVAVGFDNGTQYLQETETTHSYYGAVVGRYANRIKNGTFTIDGVTTHVPENEHLGNNTLHGGFVGYDQANWTVVAQTSSSITFQFHDYGLSDFPGEVLNIATYTLDDTQTFTSRLVSLPLTATTPIMLSNHIYWNLGAFVSPLGTTILNDTLYLPFAYRTILTDNIEVPNGSIGLTKNTPLDFTSGPTLLGPQIMSAEGYCGYNCTGIDNAFINDRSPWAGIQDPSLDVLKLWAPSTGIQLDVSTNQGGLQIYTCLSQNGSQPLKASQIHTGEGLTGKLEKYGCVVIETQDWIAGINYPEWGRDQYQIFSPSTEPAVNYAKFHFSVVH